MKNTVENTVAEGQLEHSQPSEHWNLRQPRKHQDLAPAWPPSLLLMLPVLPCCRMKPTSSACPFWAAICNAEHPPESRTSRLTPRRMHSDSCRRDTRDGETQQLKISPKLQDKWYKTSQKKCSAWILNMVVIKMWLRRVESLLEFHRDLCLAHWWAQCVKAASLYF